MKNEERIMKNFRQMLLLVFLWAGCLSASAQLYTGLSGLINTPSADMNEEGTARIGGYFMNKHFTPDDDGRYGFIYDGEKYNTVDFISHSLLSVGWKSVIRLRFRNHCWKDTKNLNTIRKTGIFLLS